MNDDGQVSNIAGVTGVCMLELQHRDGLTAENNELMVAHIHLMVYMFVYMLHVLKPWFSQRDDRISLVQFSI